MKKVLLILLVLATPISLLTGQQTLTETVGNPPETISITVWEDDDKFDLDFLTYSGTGDVRNTSSSNYAGASGLGNVFLDDAGYETLTISGITPNASCTSIDLSFGIRKDATALTGDDIVIEISTNGSDFSSAGTITLLTGGGTTGWYEKELTGLSGDIVSIRFTNNSLASGNNGNFRLDDIEIKGNGAGCTLPISLTTFTGHTHENTILLDWRTETEQNNDYIAIERSTDNGRTFEKLGTVEGAGTTIIPQNYTFVDERPAIGVNYYRLRQVDLDGSEHMHRTIAITFKTDENVLTYYPTLVKDQVILQASKSFNSDKYIEVSDLNGRILLKDIFSSNAQAHTLDVSTLQPGHYFIRIQHAAEVEVMRFVKL